ncbi:hypothetical protein [Streptomyces cadmiisoli]|uniref:hypothetical protein n=1 Tax=Streptomyces cadmiisoli TaxID=2184053 RepID=UPI00365B8265
MIITYAPEGGEPQHFDAGPRCLRASEIQIIERTADARWAEIKEAMRMGEIHALRTVAWVLKKRTDPTLRFSDFDPWEGELRVRLDAREAEGYAQAFVAKYSANPEELAEAFDELREMAHDPADAEAAIAAATAPKDPAPAPEPEPEPSPASPTDG